MSRNDRFATRLTQRLVYCAVLLLGLGFAPSSQALDKIIVDRPQSATDRRNDYAYVLLREVLERTKAEFGPYSLEQAPAYMERERLLKEMLDGTIVNVAPQPSQPSWEKALLAVAVPLDMGLQSWRLALIHRNDAPRLRAIQTLDQLKRLSNGVGSGWATQGILQANNFDLTTGANYDGLFNMLMARRFDYFLRGVNEIWAEYDDRKPGNPDLAVDDALLIHVPLPWLYFVSPKNPRLAQRISRGMESMLASGQLHRFVLRYHKANIERARLCNRRVFEVPNTLITLPELNRNELWLDLLDPKNGFCKKTSPRS